MRRRWDSADAGLLAVLVVCAAVYSPTLRYGFLYWDDLAHTFGNRYFGDFVFPWVRPSNHMYMPVTFTLWTLLARVFGPAGWAFHGLNVLLHLGSVVWLYGILRRCQEEHPGMAVLGAGLFALHPLAVEAVCWVTSLKDVASVFLVLVATNAFLTWHEQGRARSWALAASAAALASLSKAPSIAVMFGLVAGVLILRRSWRWQSWAALGLLLLVMLPGVALTVWVQSTAAPPPPAPLDRLAIVGDALGFYVMKSVMPWPMLASYGRNPTHVAGLPLGQLYLWWLVPAAMVLFAGRRHPQVWASALMFLAALMPTSGVISFGGQGNSTVADRYAYGALIGLAFGASWLLSRLPARHGVPLGVALLVATATVDVRSVRFWRDDATLWQHNIAHLPRNPTALVNMGTALNRAGRADEARDLQYLALAVDPNNGIAMLNIGADRAERGDLAGALGLFERAVELSPEVSTSWEHLCRAYVELDRWEDARRTAVAWVRHHPEDQTANRKLGALQALPLAPDPDADAWRSAVAPQ